MTVSPKVFGRRNRGRQRKRWINTISHDLISLNLTPVDVEDRDDWRRRTRVTDPSPEGYTAWRRQRERDSKLKLDVPRITAFPIETFISFASYRTILRRQRLFLQGTVWTHKTRCGGLCICDLFQNSVAKLEDLSQIYKGEVFYPRHIV